MSMVPLRLTLITRSHSSKSNASQVSRLKCGSVVNQDVNAFELGLDSRACPLHARWIADT